MSHSRFAFINGESTVVQIVVGDMDESALEGLLAGYAPMFGATNVVKVADEATSIWIGGTYDPTVGFTPPPEPIIEQPTEGTTDGIPVLE